MREEKKILEVAHISLLIVILALAAGVRFYALGNNNFNAQDLFNISFCSADGWLTMADQYAAKTGMPSLYPTLLCQLADLTSYTDFFMRSLSAVLGVGSILMVYLLGRYFLTSTTGILAATIAAVNSHVILVDRSVTHYSLFAFLYMAHLFFYCQILWSDSHKASPLHLTAEQGEFQLSLRWSPQCACHAGTLFMFWCSGLLAFYANPTVLFLFTAEAVGMLFFVECADRSRLLKWCWLPILLVLSPWLLRLSEQAHWAYENDLLAFQGSGASAFLSALLGTVDKYVALFALTLMVFFLGVRSYSKKEWQFILFIGLQLLIVIAALFFFKMIDSKSFIYMTLLFSLVLADGLARAMQKIRQQHLYIAILALLVGIGSIWKINNNAKDRVYFYGLDKGFEWAAKMVSMDDSFMASNRVIFVSSNLFNYYLKQYGVVQKNTKFLQEDKDSALIQNPIGMDFYYLEYAERGEEFTENSPIYRKFLDKFHRVCSANKKRFRVTKFSVKDDLTSTGVGNCSDYLKEQGSFL